MKRLLSFLVVFLFIGSGSAFAEHRFFNVSESAVDSREGRVAVSLSGNIVVAWQEDGGIWTRSVFNGTLLDAVYHGAGEYPALCWNSQGFTLAWAEGNTILIRSGDGSSWSDMEYFVTSHGGDAQFPHLTSYVAGVDFHDVYLTWQEAGWGVWFAYRLGGVWSYESFVCEVGQYDRSLPQALPVAGDGGMKPRIYMMEAWDMSLCFYEWEEIDWSGPQPVTDQPDYFGTDFECAGGFGESQYILSNGPQPTCPCNVLWFTEQHANGPWATPLEMTVGGGYEMDWPEHPSVAADALGGVHAFWYEEYYDGQLQLVGDAMFYKVKPLGGVWEDRSQLLSQYEGGHNDIALDPAGEPLFVFSVGDYPHRDVYLGLYDVGTAAPVAEAGALALAVHPNPCNPQAELRYALPVAGEARVELFDLQGRFLGLLAEGWHEAGEHRVTWRGRDASGRELSSGVYFVLVRAGASRGSERIVLLR